MDKNVKYLRLFFQSWPFIPWWFQYLLAMSLCFIVIVIVIGIVLYPNASNFQEIKKN